MQLNPAQEKAIAHKSGPCMVLAGPGSGKTTVITKRIQYLIEKQRVKPEEILVITFSKAASNEMRERFLSLSNERYRGVTFGTFHGIYYGILKWAYQLSSENILSEEEKFLMIQSIVGKAVVEMEDEKEFVQGIMEEIGVVKNNLVSLKDYVPQHCQKEEFQRIYQMYETERCRRKKIDFDDMLVLTYELFQERPDIRKGWQEKYSYILIDEFQDINRVQYEVVRMLALPQNNLFIVGDDDQSIYGFRGAVPEIMLNFPKDYPNTQKIVLDVNYRSTKAIVHVAERVIGHNKKRYQKKMITGNVQGVNVQIQETKTPMEESQYVVRKIQKALKQGTDFSEIAVLYRTAQEARPIVEACLEYGIPFRMNEQMPSLYDHFVARDVLSYMKMAMGDRSRGLFLKIMNRPNRYIARDVVEAQEVSFEKLRTFYEEKEWMLDRIDQLELDLRILKNCAPYAGIQYLRKHVGYDAFLEEHAKKRKMPLDDLQDVLCEIEEKAKAFSNIEDWFSYIEKYQEQERQRKEMSKSQKEGIFLATMHKSKGLEFEMVFVIGVNEGVLPYKKAELQEEIEEERRLFYVAMTRAKSLLHVSYVKQRGGKSTQPSRFLWEILGKRST